MTNNGPYPGTRYNENPQAALPLTGAEIVPLLQSGANRWTTVTSFIATITGIATGITQLTAGSGLQGGTVTTVGTFAVDIFPNGGLAFSGNQLIVSGGATAPVTSVFSRSGAVTAASGDYFSAQVTESGNLYYTTSRVQTDAPNVTLTGQNYLSISSQLITVSAISLTANTQSITPSVLIGNPTGTTGLPSFITLGANLTFSGTTLVAAGASGANGVTQISTGSGLTGGPVTSSGTISLATIAPSSLFANVSTATSVPVAAGLGTGFQFSGSTFTFSGCQISKQFTQITGANGTLALDTNASFPYVVNTIRGARTSTGSITAAFQISGVNISGLGAVVITTTAQTVTGTASNLVNIADRLTVVFSSNTSAANIEFTIGATRNA